MSGLITWFGIGLTYYRFYKEMKAQGACSRSLHEYNHSQHGVLSVALHFRHAHLARTLCQSTWVGLCQRRDRIRRDDVRFFLFLFLPPFSFCVGIVI